MGFPMFFVSLPYGNVSWGVVFPFFPGEIRFQNRQTPGNRFETLQTALAQAGEWRHAVTMHIYASYMIIFVNTFTLGV